MIWGTVIWGEAAVGDQDGLRKWEAKEAQNNQNHWVVEQWLLVINDACVSLVDSR